MASPASGSADVPESGLVREHLFGDLRPFAQCHASTLVPLSGGRLLVAWFGGPYEGHRDVAIWASERGPIARAPASTRDARQPVPTSRPGAGWSEPRRIARAAPLPHWNPVLFALSEQDLVLHFKVGRRISSWQTWSQYSHDAGRTWEPAFPLVPGDRGGRGCVKNKPVRLDSGEWLAGASLERWGHWEAFVDRSPDGRTSWEASPPIPLDRSRFPGKGLIQPSLFTSGGESVHALLRSTADRIYRSDSRDAGRTWSAARATDVPHNNSGLDAVRLQSGTLALACNPVAGNRAARSPLSILFSMDEGQSWPARIDVETSPGEYSYPALVELEGGLALSYTWNRRRIVFAFLPSASIPDRAAPSLSGFA